VAELLLVLGPELPMILEELDDVLDQVAEVDGVVLF